MSVLPVGLVLTFVWLWDCHWWWCHCQQCCSTANTAFPFNLRMPTRPPPHTHMLSRECTYFYTSTTIVLYVCCTYMCAIDYHCVWGVPNSPSCLAWPVSHRWHQLTSHSPLLTDTDWKCSELELSAAATQGNGSHTGVGLLPDMDLTSYIIPSTLIMGCVGVVWLCGCVVYNVKGPSVLFSKVVHTL